jgi:hypothetical protein
LRVAGVLTSVAGANLLVEIMFDVDKVFKFVHFLKIFLSLYKVIYNVIA